MDDIEYIKTNILKLPDAVIIKILITFYDKLDECKARVEKQGIGTYLLLDKIPKNLSFNIRKLIETAL